MINDLCWAQGLWWVAWHQHLRSWVAKMSSFLSSLLPSFSISLLVLNNKEKNKNLQNIVNFYLLIFSPLTITFNADMPAQCLKVSTPAKVDNLIWGHPQSNAHLSFLSQHRTNFQEDPPCRLFFLEFHFSSFIISNTPFFWTLTLSPFGPHFVPIGVKEELKSITLTKKKKKVEKSHSTSICPIMPPSLLVPLFCSFPPFLLPFFLLFV